MDTNDVSLYNYAIMTIQSKIDFVNKYVMLTKSQKEFLFYYDETPFLISLIRLARYNSKLVMAIDKYCKAYPEKINKCTKSSVSPLVTAISTNVEIASILCKHGANVNFEGYYGEVALQHACMENIRVVKILLEYDASINIANIWGNKPFYFCKSEEDKNIFLTFCNNINILNIKS